MLYTWAGSSGRLRHTAPARGPSEQMQTKPESVQRCHANLLCIVPIWTNGPRRESSERACEDDRGCLFVNHWTNTYIYIYIYMYIYIYTYTCISLSLSLSLYIYMYIYIYTSYIYTYMYMYIYIYIMLPCFTLFV